MTSRHYRLELESLTDRITPASLYATAAPNSSLVVIVDALSGEVVRTIQAFDPAFTGGVSIAQGDVNRDRTADVIVGAGAGGGPHVKVFDGETGQELSSFFAFDVSFTGGVTVAAADVNNDAHADIIVGAGAGGGPHVKVFDGITGATIYSFFAFESTFAGGVNVTAGDFKPDGSADIVAAAGAGGGPAISIFDGRNGQELTRFYAFEAEFTGGVNAVASDFFGEGQADLLVGAGSGGAPRVRLFRDAGLTIAADFFAADASSRTGALVAATDSSGNALDEFVTAAGGILSFYDPKSLEQRQSFTNDAVAIAGAVTRGIGTEPAKNNPVKPEGDFTERVGMYNPGSGYPGAGSFVPVNLMELDLEPSQNVYVIVHGWAPGYLDWSYDYTSRTGDTLRWWQTNPLDQAYDGTDNPDNLPPASAFLFQGQPYPAQPGDVVVSTLGMAQAIAEVDFDSVILAYSWIDESATENEFFNEIPHDANISEAYTDLNGLRLAAALQELLPSGIDNNLRLIGHSHGSKVATIAAVELEKAGVPVQQLTILDSPEDGTITNLAEAVNFNWYYLQDLDISNDTGDGTFVVNIISEFDSRYSNINLPNLSEIIDVTLDPILYSSIDFSNRHTYSANWYAGLTENHRNGFDPNLSSTPPSTPFASHYTQAWQELPQDIDEQFELDVAEPFPPTATVNPQFIDVDFVADESTGNVTANLDTGTVTLSDATGQATWTAYFDQESETAGIAFDYQFTDAFSTDQISISINGDLVWVMNGVYTGNGVHTATLSHYDLVGDLICNKYLPGDTCTTMTVALSPSLGSTGTATVVLSNFRQISL